MANNWLVYLVLFRSRLKASKTRLKALEIALFFVLYWDPLRVLFRAYTAKFKRVFLDLLRSFELVRWFGPAALICAACCCACLVRCWLAVGPLLLVPGSGPAARIWSADQLKM